MALSFTDIPSTLSPGETSLKCTISGGFTTPTTGNTTLKLGGASGTTLTVTDVTPVAGTATTKSLAITLSTAGRILPYIDYSELSDSGNHVFYVQRTHGTSGAVTVDYVTEGDEHTILSGTLSWADGQADILSVTVPVTSSDLTTHQTTNGLGDHRIRLKLENPTGGAVLHWGANASYAIGIIDNGTVATDANAVFYDSAASGGTGTSADPYDNIETAIANVGSKRYIYGKGTTTVTNTFSALGIGGGPTCYHIAAPATRANEDARVYVQAWPGNTWTVTGDPARTDVGGFFAENGESYCTYRNIDITTFDGTTTGGFGIWYRYGNSVNLNFEYITGTLLDGSAGSNKSVIGPWGVNGVKIWRCSGDDIKIAGAINGNGGVFQSYDGENISIQRCSDTANSNYLLFHKKTNSLETSTAVKFCHCVTTLKYGVAGAFDDPHSYSIVQGNLFEDCSQGGIFHSSDQGSSGIAEKNWVVNNVFDNCGSGEVAAIHFRYFYEAIIFNNIMFNCRKVWAEYSDKSADGADVEYADYNVEFGTTLTAQRYEWHGINYTTAALLNAASGFAGNDVEGDPDFTDETNDDYTLGGSSAASGAGVDGSDAGIYLTGIEPPMGP